ncbi:MAG: ABC transporter permease [Candidatus Nanoarchaeia archaeon]|nr:ABC transporter permease [Candidatus Nanoarchaeia archaeon]
MKKLAGIVKKNFRLLMRSKSSSLIVVFGPLLLVLLVGVAFNTANVSGIKISTYSEKYSALTEDLINGIKETKFAVNKLDSQEDCIESVKLGTGHMCIVFPTNLNVQSSNDIIFHVDPSRVNLVYTVKETITNEIEGKSNEISKQLAEGVLGKLSETNLEINDKKTLITSVSSSLRGAESSVVKSIATLEAVDMNRDFDDIPWSDLEAKFGNDTANFDKTYGAIKQQVREFGDILEQVRIARDTANRELTSARSIISQNGLLVGSLGSSLDLIQKNINSLDVKDADTIANPIETQIKPIVTEKSNLNFLFPTLLAMLVMFTGLLLSSTVMIREKSASANFRNFLTPTHNIWFVLGNFITNFLIISLQMVVVLGVSYYFFGKTLLDVVPNLLGALGIIATMYIFVGMFIGQIFKSEETGALASLSTGSLMLFMSNTILPLESLPAFMVKVGLYNPFVISEGIIRKITLFNSSLEAQLTSVYILTGILVGFFILTYIADLRRKN